MGRGIQGRVVHLAMVPDEAEDHVGSGDSLGREGNVEILAPILGEVPPLPGHDQGAARDETRLALLVIFMAHHGIEVGIGRGGRSIEIEGTLPYFRDDIRHLVVPGGSTDAANGAAYNDTAPARPASWPQLSEHAWQKYRG